VTDSGAAGTALATGHKTDNGAIGVLPDGTPVGSVMEAAKLAGYLTGLVVTSPISHATPAGNKFFTSYYTTFTDMMKSTSRTL
jgi:alkaline phosphatase